MNKKILIACGLFGTFAFADNPFVQTNYTADPAPFVYKDTLYAYTGHDEDGSTNFNMLDWRVYSTVDMVNWTDRGSPLSYKTFPWSGGKAWAAQLTERNGKFYWYVTAGIAAKGNQPAIGVAVGDSPIGPFKDPLGKPLFSNSWDDIDPTVYTDSDGQAYLYWGNPKLYYLKLNADMISHTGGLQTIPMTTASFGTRTGDANRTTTYEEGPWFFKRNNLYYMIFAAGPIPEHIAYSTSPGPTGPWTYRGKVISATNSGSFTNHAGAVEYKNKWYLFYHTGKLPGGGGYTRSVAVESFQFNADGTIPVVSMTTAGPAPIANLNPYRRVEAETMASSEGLKVAQDAQTGVYVTKINNGDNIKLRSVDFSLATVDSVIVRAACAGTGGTIEFRQGSKTGTVLATVTIANTGGATTWKNFSAPLSAVSGVNDLFLMFKGSGTGDLFNFDAWEWKSKATTPQTPYNANPIAIPGTLQVEQYDNGGEGSAYHDADPANSGAELRQDGVDIVKSDNNGYAVGYTQTGEWLEYTVQVSKAGPQPFQARVSSGGAGGAMRLEVDGVPITDSLVIPNTGSWDTYQILSDTTAALTAGPHVLRLSVLGPYFNIDWISFGDSTPVRIDRKFGLDRLKPTPDLFDLNGRIRDVK
jgi:arabinoxylan arabinofuranohydrolase